MSVSPKSLYASHTYSPWSSGNTSGIISMRLLPSAFMRQTGSVGGISLLLCTHTMSMGGVPINNQQTHAMQLSGPFSSWRLTEVSLSEWSSADQKCGFRLKLNFACGFCLLLICSLKLNFSKISFINISLKWNICVVPVSLPTLIKLNPTLNIKMVFGEKKYLKWALFQFLSLFSSKDVIRKFNHFPT